MNIHWFVVVRTCLCTGMISCILPKASATQWASISHALGKLRDSELGIETPRRLHDRSEQSQPSSDDSLLAPSEQQLVPFDDTQFAIVPYMPVVHLRVGMILDDGSSNASPAVKMVFEGLPGLDFDDDIAAALASKHHSPGCHAVKKEAKLALQVKLKVGKVQKATAKAEKAAAKVQATLARKAKVAPKVKVGAKKVETEHTEATYRKYEFALAHNVSKQIR